MTRGELQASLQQRRDEFARSKAMVDGAVVIDQILAEVEALAESEGDTLLTLKHASALSGYSEEHLGRLIRQGKIPNAGRARAPRIKVRDLPVRPKNALASSEKSSYDPRADARFFRADRR